MIFEKMNNVTILDHPLIKHKVTLLRDKKILSDSFRRIVEEIAMLEGIEVFRDLPLTFVEVETPVEKCMSPRLSDNKLLLVPILRAGLGMVNGVLNLVPDAQIGFIGFNREEKTHVPVEYCCKLPDSLEDSVVVVIDPMLATGGTAIEAISLIKKRGAKKIKFMCIIAAPEGLKCLCNIHPDVQIYVGQLDRCLNDAAYICPGLGDVGDRIFGTK